MPQWSREFVVGWWVVGLLLVALGVGLGRWWARRRASSAQVARVRVAGAGERRARELLERAGYAVVAEQERGLWWIEVDGDPLEIEVRADFVVASLGRRYVAEVKTGETAPDIGHPATRRQLLEYALAFDLDGVLLVDAEAGTIQEVRFPAVRTDSIDGEAG